jgi:hypothetical protein
LIGFLTTDGDAPQYSNSFSKSFSQAAINAQTAAIEILGDPSEQEN